MKLLIIMNNLELATLVALLFSSRQSCYLSLGIIIVVNLLPNYSGSKFDE